MTIRRRAAVVGAVLAGLASLAACDKPTPYTTVTSGSDSAHTEAVCYADGKKLSDSRLRACLKKKPTETIKVDSGEKVHFGVDPSVAEVGWFLAINGAPVTEPVKDTYRSFNGDAFFTNQQTRTPLDEVTVTVVEARQNSGGRGVWAFQVERG